MKCGTPRPGGPIQAPREGEEGCEIRFWAQQWGYEVRLVLRRSCGGEDLQNPELCRPSAARTSRVRSQCPSRIATRCGTRTSIAASQATERLSRSVDCGMRARSSRGRKRKRLSMLPPPLVAAALAGTQTRTPGDVAEEGIAASSGRAAHPFTSTLLVQ